MTATFFLAVFAIAIANRATVALAQNGPPPDMKTMLSGPPPILTIDRPQTKTNGKLTVTSSTFANGQIPVKNTGYGQSISPQVAWSKGPNDTKSYVLIMEDATAGRDRKGVLHWIAFNIPTDVRDLPEGLPKIPAGMIVANNVEGKPQYTGPHAPVGGPPFHYHIEVFALDTTLKLTSEASREAVWDAMNGHVLAKGDVVGTFQGPAQKAQ
jgi:Raf kinase inhibitor-like YbhB/YbcL family protein